MPTLFVNRPEDLVGVPPGDDEPRPQVHVCVSGVTGAGKTTVLERVSTLLAVHRRNVVVLDERALHHPYLDRLFVDPGNFAFEVQVQFMISRALFVKRWWDAGYSLVMERSHAEDPVFIRHLLANGHVTPVERDAYMGMWARLDERLPPPSLMLYLAVEPSVSIERLRRDDRPDQRPPFVDEASQRAWVASWHARYEERIAELAVDPRFSDAIVTFTGRVDQDRLAAVIAEVAGDH